MRGLSFEVQYGEFEGVKQLIAMGADVNEDNSKPLYLAAERGKTAIVQELLEHGADAGRAVCAAAGNGHHECVRQLTPHTEPFTNSVAMWFAAGNGHMNCVNELLPYFDAELLWKDWSLEGIKPEILAHINAYCEGQQLRANLPSVSDEMHSQGLKQSRGRRL